VIIDVPSAKHGQRHGRTSYSQQESRSLPHCVENIRQTESITACQGAQRSSALCIGTPLTKQECHTPKTIGPGIVPNRRNMTFCVPIAKLVCSALTDRRITVVAGTLFWNNTTAASKLRTPQGQGIAVGRTKKVKNMMKNKQARKGTSAVQPLSHFPALAEPPSRLGSVLQSDIVTSL